MKLSLEFVPIKTLMLLILVTVNLRRVIVKSLNKRFLCKKMKVVKEPQSQKMLAVKEFVQDWYKASV